MPGSSGLISVAVDYHLLGEMPEVGRHRMPKDVNHRRQINPLFWIDFWKKLSFPIDLGDAGGSRVCWILIFPCTPLLSSLTESWPFGLWHSSKCMVRVLCLRSLSSILFGYFFSERNNQPNIYFFSRPSLLILLSFFTITYIWIH